MADKNKLPKGYSIQTKFDSTYGAFATVQVLMKGGEEIATIRNGKIVESSDPKIAVGSTAESAISYVSSPKPSSKTKNTSTVAPTSNVDLERVTQDAKDEVSRAKIIADSYPVGSKQYKSAIADYQAAQAKLEALPTTVGEANQSVQKTASDKQINDAQSRVSDAQKALSDAQARAADFPNDASAKAIVQEKQKALVDAQSAAKKAGDAAAVTSNANQQTASSTAGKKSTVTTDPQADLYQGGGAVSASTPGKKTAGKTTGTTTSSGTSGVNGTVSSTSSKKIVTPTTPASVSSDAMAKFYSEYGVQAALVDSDPSLKALFQKAMDKKYTPAQFKAEFQNTKWAQDRSGSAQQAETARLEAPATYAQAYDGMRNYLARLAVTMGENLNPSDLGGAYDPAKGRQGNLVEAALDQQWGGGLDETKMRNLILSKAKLNTALPGGEAGNYMSQLKSLANDYGMNSLTTNGSQWLQDNAQAILLGKMDINTVKQQVVEQAKLNYKPYAAQLDAGVSLRGIATPYLNTLSNLLEVPIDSIDLSSPTGYGKMVSNALMGSDPTNPTPMTLNAFETQVKQDPRWASTTNARDTVMSGVGGLLKLLGKVS